MDIIILKIIMCGMIFLCVLILLTILYENGDV